MLRDEDICFEFLLCWKFFSAVGIKWSIQNYIGWSEHRMQKIVLKCFKYKYDDDACSWVWLVVDLFTGLIHRDVPQGKWSLKSKKLSIKVINKQSISSTVWKMRRNRMCVANNVGFALLKTKRWWLWFTDDRGHRLLYILDTQLTSCWNIFFII